MASPSSEEQPPPPISQPSPRREETPKECLHKTKSIQFFNRSTPIILQNDNGPCPLLAICNVLLLRNQLNLSADISEVSQEKLLSLVAERLIDSNSNIDNKDAEYVQNQQQNISDAIDLLPRLTTGIDVNIKFQRIGDFEFTRECAIFDLLDIPLYHGWLVDPQDYATAKAIGSKSYNTITRELVFLQEMDGKGKAKSEEDCVDFAAATAATLGVPSPSLSRTKSCNDSPRSAPEESYVRKGDAEEEAELMRVLQLSEKTPPVEGHDSIASGPCGENSTVISDENIHQMEITPMSPKDKLHEDDANGKFQGEQLLSGGSVLPCSSDDLISFEEPDQCNNLSPNPMVVEPRDQLSFTQFQGSSVGDLTKDGTWAQNQTKSSPFSGIDSLLVHDQDTQLQSSTDCLDKDTPTLSGNEMPASAIMDADLQIQTAPDAGLDTKIHDESGIEDSNVMSGHSDTLSSNIQKSEATESFTSSLNNSEPIYEGEERILDSSATVCEVREPIYEGEVVLAKQGDESNIDVHDSRLKDEITPEEGELIGNFLKSNASQLTFYGLFSLQEGLKERELCVFFRNNHFCTMYKLDGELYLLTTDQGYLTQPGIVWEKLNEVNGDSVFYDTNFQEFRPETQSSGTWDEQNAVANTADYLAKIGNPGQDGSSINSDLQLAIALQQQEFDEQQSQRRAPQQPTQGCARVPGSVPDSGRGPGAGGGSRLITGPQTPRTSARPSTSSPKQDKKSKDGCSIM